MLVIEKSVIIKFQNQILNWYEKHKRDLPWRKNRNPYDILISEVMSQQTQIARVIPKYNAWVTELPTIQHLANAPTADVLRLWSGLGYNRRALNLKKTAENITKKFSGEFPQNEKQLLELPGIGIYTARAILCFAFNKQIAVVDTNVRKVILTQFLKGQDNKNDGKIVEEIATLLLPKGKAYEWNQALMDYAGVVLKKEKIALPKQSKFIGSHRYYRGQILKTLLQKKSVTIKELGPLIKKEYTISEEEWLNSLVSELKDEGFVQIEYNMISLKK